MTKYFSNLKNATQQELIWNKEINVTLSGTCYSTGSTVLSPRLRIGRRNHNFFFYLFFGIYWNKPRKTRRTKKKKNVIGLSVLLTRVTIETFGLIRSFFGWLMRNDFRLCYLIIITETVYARNRIFLKNFTQLFLNAHMPTIKNWFPCAESVILCSRSFLGKRYIK